MTYEAKVEFIIFRLLGVLYRAVVSEGKLAPALGQSPFILPQPCSPHRGPCIPLCGLPKPHSSSIHTSSLSSDSSTLGILWTSSLSFEDGPREEALKAQGHLDRVLIT